MSTKTENIIIKGDLQKMLEEKFVCSLDGDERHSEFLDEYFMSQQDEPGEEWEAYLFKEDTTPGRAAGANERGATAPQRVNKRRPATPLPPLNNMGLTWG